MNESLSEIVGRNRRGEAVGIYAVCCAHPLVIEAAIDQAIDDDSCLLIEATANQSNQFGGYTGLTPDQFRDFVYEIADRQGLARSKALLGGDHLGPVCWTGEPMDSALLKAEELVKAYAKAGFRKIHLDCSMPLAGDPEQLDDAIVAERAARLCAAAEQTAIAQFGESRIVYVIGTEVPPPGGADETLDEIEVTPAARARQTLELHRNAFVQQGLMSAWERVIALVVQPGVEFDHSAVIDYKPAKTEQLKLLAEDAAGGIAFEAHSTDYQRPQAFAELVRDHFAVLKVGPALTFALREALFALSHIEDALFPAELRSNLRQVCDERMLAEPKFWQRFYHGSAAELDVLRRFSLSDRIRYYWPDPAVGAAVERLLANMTAQPLPYGLLSQFLPEEYQKLRAGKIAADPISLVKARIRAVIEPYARACNPALEKAA